MLKDLFLAGVDTFRLNFSHGTREDHKTVHASIRALEKELNRPIGIMQDLQGPKIRIGVVGSGQRTAHAHEIIRFTLGEAAGSGEIQLPHSVIFESIKVGHQFLIDDGRLRFQVKAVTSTYLDAEAIVGGVLTSRKGVNLPDTLLQLSPLTAKDKSDLDFGLELGVDWVALSFVQRPSDLVEARDIVGNNAGLLAKIEKPAAFDQIDDIVALSDAVMVARGDLGVEIPPEDVPGRQKELVSLCRRLGKPVIVATQMLDSMVQAPTPTRAEVSDVATAIFDGADAVMLSAESATGKYPLEAVKMMDNVIRQTERHRLYGPLIKAIHHAKAGSVAQTVAASAAGLAENLEAAAIVAFTASGATASRIARERPCIPTIAVTPDIGTSRRACLLWGVQSILAPEAGDLEKMLAQAGQHVREAGLSKPSTPMVVVSGVPFGMSGTTNNIRVLQCE
jgi:pyruvate kinase